MRIIRFYKNTNDKSDLTIDIKYLPNAHHIEKIEVGSWIDLYTYEEVTMKQGDQKYINLGVAMKLPEGYEAIMAPRSSTFKNWGITQTNSIGVIDSSYCGDNDIWIFPAHATRNITIPKDTRICQFRIQEEQPTIKFNIVESLGTEDRGGLGSTGE